MTERSPRNAQVVAEQPVADLTALLTVWAAVLVGALVVLSVPTPAASLDVFLVIGTTVPLWATAGYGLIVFVRVFRQGSAVRAALTVVPRRFHLLAYGWAFAVVVPTLVVPRVAFGDVPDEWYPQSALELWLHRPVPAGAVIALGLVCSVTLAVNAHLQSRRASQRPERAG